MTKDLITIDNLSKVYDNGFNALKTVNLNIKQGEIIAMLGPNGAGKTTLISIVCGIVKPTSRSWFNYTTYNTYQCSFASSIWSKHSNNFTLLYI